MTNYNSCIYKYDQPNPKVPDLMFTYSRFLYQGVLNVVSGVITELKMISEYQTIAMIDDIN